MLGNGFPSPRQRAVAAARYAGPGAVVTGAAALHEFGHGKPPIDVHVLIPVERRVLPSGFVVVERTRRMPDTVTRHGLAYAHLDRAVIDAGRRCTTVDAVRTVVAPVVQRGASTPDRLALAVDAGSQRGSALVRAVLEEISANVHSVAEADALALWRRSRLPPMTCNADIVTVTGEFLGRPDGWFDDVALAWEIDSQEWHLSPRHWAATMDKRSRLQSHHVVVFATRPKLLRTNESRVIAELRAHYDLAAARPRPPVRIRRPGPDHTPG